MSRSEKRREARKADSGGSSGLYWILGLVAVAGIGLVAYSVGANAFSAAALENDQELVELAQGVTMGDEAAPVSIVEFGDYQCPACASFAVQLKPRIEAQLVETGEAKFVFYDFPIVSIHPNAFLAARAARCAGAQDAYWEYHDVLFQNQSRWSTANLPMSAFEDYAGQVGIDEGQFAECLDSDRFADVVTANMQVGNRLGVSGTPTVLVRAGGQTVRLNDYSVAGIRDVVAGITGDSSGN